MDTVNIWRGHKLRRVKVNNRFKVGVWLGGMLIVPAEKSVYDNSNGGWMKRKWESSAWDAGVS